MRDRYLVRVTGDRGQEIDSAETPAQPSPPVDAVRSNVPGSAGTRRVQGQNRRH